MELSRSKIVSLVCLFCIFSSNSVLSQLTSEDLIYEAGELGKLRGNAAKTIRTGRPYVELLGIPYVEPLTQDTRFLPPQDKVLPLVPAGQTYAATRKPACCPQSKTNLLCALNQKEDCLGMNIYTPQIQKKDGGKPFDKLLPVIVFIHGGAFTLGSADSYSGARLLERDVVLVNFNYRLGTLGFFNLNILEAPGNAAMYDMVAALNFVKKHIEHFGGDPERITIAGQSAGSVSVTHLMLSPLTRDKGLFHRAIGLSGSALCEWGTTTAEEAEAASLEVATDLGCYDPAGVYEPSKVVACVRGKPVSELVEKLAAYQRRENNHGRLGFAPATPAIQKVAPGGVAFLNESPEDILVRHQEANVPLMMGAARHDGSFVLGVVYNQFLRYHGLVENSTYLKTDFLPTVLKALGIKDKTEAVYDTLAEAYIGPQAKSTGVLTDMLPGLTDLHTVFYFKAAAFRTLKLHSRHQPQSFWYDFDYKGTRSVYSLTVNTTGNPVQGGVAHGDDLLYLFNVPLMSLTKPEDLEVSDRLVNYWANFAHTGNPSINEHGHQSDIGNGNSWTSFSEDSPSFIKIGHSDNYLRDSPSNHWKGVANDLYG